MDQYEFNIRLLKRLKNIDNRITISSALVFSLIAQKEGCCVSEIADKASLSLSTCSKIIHGLGERRQKGIPLRLVKIIRDKTSKRNKNVFLSQAGKDLLEGVEFGKRW